MFNFFIRLCNGMLINDVLRFMTPLLSFGVILDLKIVTYPFWKNLKIFLFAILKCLNRNCWFWITVIDIFFLISLILKFMIMIHWFWSLWCVNDVFLFDQQVNQSKGSHYDSMSDSETDDAWRAVLLSRTKLNEVKQRLRNLEEDDQFTKNSVELVIKTSFLQQNMY